MTRTGLDLRVPDAEREAAFEYEERLLHGAVQVRHGPWPLVPGELGEREGATGRPTGREHPHAGDAEIDDAALARGDHVCLSREQHGCLLPW